MTDTIQIYTNGAWHDVAEYGVVLTGGYETLLEGPELRGVYANDWPEYSGLEVDLSDVTFAPHEVKLSVGFRNQYGRTTFIGLLKNAPYHFFQFGAIGSIFRLRYIGMTANDWDGIPTATLNFSNDDPFVVWENRKIGTGEITGPELEEELKPDTPIIGGRATLNPAEELAADIISYPFVPETPDFNPDAYPYPDWQLGLSGDGLGEDTDYAALSWYGVFPAYGILDAVTDKGNVKGLYVRNIAEYDGAKAYGAIVDAGRDLSLTLYAVAPTGAKMVSNLRQLVYDLSKRGKTQELSTPHGSFEVYYTKMDITDVVFGDEVVATLKLTLKSTK